jgi:hypothetical protein
LSFSLSKPIYYISNVKNLGNKTPFNNNNNIFIICSFIVGKSESSQGIFGPGGFPTHPSKTFFLDPKAQKSWSKEVGATLGRTYRKTSENTRHNNKSKKCKKIRTKKQYNLACLIFPNYICSFPKSKLYGKVRHLVKGLCQEKKAENAWEKTKRAHFSLDKKKHEETFFQSIMHFAARPALGGGQSYGSLVGPTKKKKKKSSSVCLKRQGGLAFVDKKIHTFSLGLIQMQN